MKNSNDHIENRTRDLPSCSSVHDRNRTRAIWVTDRQFNDGPLSQLYDNNDDEEVEDDDER
jgi:hypothetical protein